MKITIEIDELYGEAMKLMWRELTFDEGRAFESRQAMIAYILMMTVNSYPEYLSAAQGAVVYERERKKLDGDFEPYFSAKSVEEGVAHMLSGDVPVGGETVLTEEEVMVAREIFGVAWDGETPVLPEM